MNKNIMTCTNKLFIKKKTAKFWYFGKRISSDFKENINDKNNDSF